MKKPKTRSPIWPINCLPEEIIMIIFNKISDAKSLCRCSLVSKKFCSLVLQTHIVSVKIPSWVRASSFKESLSSMTEFLMKFSRIESITIHLDFEGNTVLEPLGKWSYNRHGFVFVSAENVGVGVDKVVSSDSNFNIIDNINFGKMLVNIRYYYLEDAFCRIELTFMIIAKLVGLKNVLVLDSMNEGRISLNEDSLVSSMGRRTFFGKGSSFRVWHAPLLRLPLTGCVVKEVTVIGLKDVGHDENLFEDKLFSELAVVMMKKKTCYESI